MSYKMPKEESTVLMLLSVFGALEKESVNYALSRVCGNENNLWYLERMKRGMQIFSRDNSYLATPRSEPIDRNETCFWVLTKYLDTLEIATMQREFEPAGVSFIRNNKYYRIVKASPDPATTFAMIRRVDFEDMNFIVVLDSEKDIDDYSDYERDMVFAVVEPHKTGVIPEVYFYKKQIVSRK